MSTLNIVFANNEQWIKSLCQPGMLAERGCEDHDLVLAGGHLLEAVDLVPAAGVAGVHHAGAPRQPRQVALGPARHRQLVVRHRDLLDHLGGRVPRDPVSHVLLVLRAELLELVLGEEAEEVLLELDGLAVPLLVVLPQVLTVAQLVGPVRLGPVRAARLHEQTLQQTQGIRSTVVTRV